MEQKLARTSSFPGPITLLSSLFMCQPAMNHMATGGLIVGRIRRRVSVEGHESHTRASSLRDQGPKNPRTASDCPRGFSGYEWSWKCTAGGAGRVSPKQGVASGPTYQPDGQSLAPDRLALNWHCPLCARNRWRVDDRERTPSRLRRFQQSHCSVSLTSSLSLVLGEPPLGSVNQTLSLSPWLQSTG